MCAKQDQVINTLNYKKYIIKGGTKMIDAGNALKKIENI